VRDVRCLALAGAALLLSGCVSSMLAKQVVAPPNKSGIKPLFADSEILKRAPAAFSQTWTVPVGPPAARIAVASVEPGDYGFIYDLRMEYTDDKAPHIAHFNAFWRPAGERCAPRTAARHDRAAARLPADPGFRDTLGCAPGAGRLSLRVDRSSRSRSVDRRAHFFRRLRIA
jgi:hypothetical protein